MKNKKYFLVGMPASGKSTIGKLIGRQLGFNFIDLDKVIVEHEGMEITDIFSAKGETYFREVERKYLVELVDSEDGFVLATGGGAPCFYNNMDLMNGSGITIFLDVSINDLFEKLSRKGTSKRPLLKNFSNADLHEELLNKYNSRKEFYEKSKICLEQNLGEVTERVNQVIFAIKSLEK